MDKLYMVYYWSRDTWHSYGYPVDRERAVEMAKRFQSPLGSPVYRTKIVQMKPGGEQEVFENPDQDQFDEIIRRLKQL